MSPPSTPESPPAGRLARLWAYQAERFPVFRHGLLILAFSGGEALYGAHLRAGGGAWRPDLAAVVVAAVVCLLFFLQLRIADEHKDAEDDRRWRPERAVPRGLVSLGELRGAAALAALVQAGVVALYSPALLPVLAAVWAFMALMSVEFFVPAFLRARPLLYLGSHMLVMPLIAGFSVSCGLRSPGAVFAGSGIGAGLLAFLALALCNGVMIEIGRKTWALESEREGVETYSRLWGARPAALATGAMGTAATGAALAAERLTGSGGWSVFAVGLGWGALLVGVGAFLRRPSPKTARAMETVCGLAALASYVGVAWLPTLLQALAR